MFGFSFLIHLFFSFLICLYTFSWEFHPTKAMSSQSPAPSLPSHPLHIQLPLRLHHRNTHTPCPTLSTSLILLILLSFPETSFILFPNFYFYLPFEDFHDLLCCEIIPFPQNSQILDLKFSQEFYSFMFFIMITNTYSPCYIIKSMSSSSLNVLHPKDT